MVSLEEVGHSEGGLGSHIYAKATTGAIVHLLLPPF